MTGWTLAMWIAVSAAGVLTCGLFAGLETGFYSLNRVRLHLLSHQGESRAKRIAQLVANQGSLITTLLVGTNVATNIATSAMGVMFHANAMSEWQVIGATVLIETPILFVFAETLPKDLFAAHADRLVYPFATPIFWFKRLLTWMGILPLITGIGHLITRRFKIAQTTFHPRLLVTSLVREGLGRGLLSDEQSAIVERVMALAGRTISHEMIPWESVIHVTVDDDPAVLRDLADRTSYSRFPVVDTGGQVVGVVNVMDALLHEAGSYPPISELMKPAIVLEPQMALRAALRRLQKDRVPLAVVAEAGKPVGVVTIKDLVEPITGELASW